MPASEGADNRRNGGARAAAGASAELLELLHEAARRAASDVHLVSGYPPTFRVHGKLESVGEQLLEPQVLQSMVRSLAPGRLDGSRSQRAGDSSVSIVHNGTTCRFRANVYLSQNQWCACLRHITTEIPSFEWLGFPEELAAALVSYNNGLVIITGVTGSGKSATLAALIALLRHSGQHHVLTVEEPIEYVHPPGAGGIVTQREVGRDVDSFADGLKYGLRQDPDVILVGEIRDRETAQMALSAAETGHLIFTTLHTRDAKGALTRLVDLFPHDSQDDLRKQLAMSLRSVVTQHLLPSAVAGEKRVLALEVLHASSQVQAAIRAGKIETIESAIQTGKRGGMLMLDDDLQRLVRAGRITAEIARRFAKEPESITANARTW
ncbi:MAG: PilT/PilU family type 4a pilus ATPase [Planctomycetes bacterium]|nr:PilT/PilU family type 4a pilus ATPase [Planctomycetota bacterium]